MQAFEVGLVDLANLVAIHDLDEQIERLLLGHMQQDGRDEKGQTLAVADLFVVDRVRFAQLVESLLTCLFLKVRMAWECAVYVAQDDILARRVFGQQQTVGFDHALFVLVASGQQLPHFTAQSFRYS